MRFSWCWPCVVACSCYFSFMCLWPCCIGYLLLVLMPQILCDVHSTVQINDAECYQFRRPSIAGSGISSMHCHVMICHAHSQLPQLSAAGCHTTLVSSIPCWVMPVPLHTVSLVSDWHKPYKAPFGPMWLGYWGFDMHS